MIPTLAGPAERKLRREPGEDMYHVARRLRFAAATRARARARVRSSADVDDKVLQTLIPQELSLAQARQARREAIAQQRLHAAYYVDLTERIAAVQDHLNQADDDTGAAGRTGRSDDDELERALAEENDASDALLMHVPLITGESFEAYRLRAARSRTNDLVASLHSEEDVLLIAQLDSWVSARSREAAEESRGGLGLRAILLAANSIATIVPDNEVGSLLRGRDEAQRVALLAFGGSLNSHAEHARARAAGALQRAAVEAASSGAGQPQAVAILVRASLRRSVAARAKHGGGAAAASDLSARVDLLLQAHKLRTDMVTATEARQEVLAAETREALAAAARLAASVPVKQQRVRVLIADADSHAMAARETDASDPHGADGDAAREWLARPLRASSTTVHAAIAAQPGLPPPDASVPAALGLALRELAAARRDEADLNDELEALRAEARDDAADGAAAAALEADELETLPISPNGAGAATARSPVACTPSSAGGGPRAASERALAATARSPVEFTPSSAGGGPRAASERALASSPRSAGASTPTVGNASTSGAERALTELAAATHALRSVAAEMTAAALTRDDIMRDAAAGWAAQRARLDAADPPTARASELLAAEAGRRSERALATAARLAKAEAELARLVAQLVARLRAQQQSPPSVSVADEAEEAELVARAAGALRWLAIEHEATQLALGDARAAAAECECADAALAQAGARLATLYHDVDGFEPHAVARARIRALLLAVDGDDGSDVALDDDELRALREAAVGGGGAARDDDGARALDARAGLAEPSTASVQAAAREAAALTALALAGADARAGGAAAARLARTAKAAAKAAAPPTRVSHRPSIARTAQAAAAKAAKAAARAMAEQAASAARSEAAAAARDQALAARARAEAARLAASVNSKSATSADANAAMAAAASVSAAAADAADADANAAEAAASAAAADLDAADAETLARFGHLRARLSARLLQRELKAERARTRGAGMVDALSRASRIVAKLRVTVQAVDVVVVEAAVRIGEIDLLKAPLPNAEPSWSEREQRYHAEAMSAQAVNMALLKRLQAVERQSGWWRARFVDFFSDEIAAEIAPLLAQSASLPDWGVRVLELLPSNSIVEALERDELIRSWRELARDYVPPAPVRPGRLPQKRAGGGGAGRPGNATTAQPDDGDGSWRASANRRPDDQGLEQSVARARARLEAAGTVAL